MKKKSEMETLDNLAAAKFLKQITASLVPVANEKSEELVHLSALTIISSLFPRVRLLNAEQQKKTLNLYLGVVGPPASGKSLALAPLVLLTELKRCIDESLTTAGQRPSFPDRAVVLPANVTKTRLIDHLWVNMVTDTPTIIAESETSTLVSALSNGFGNFYDVLNKIGENEPISYSRKKDNVTVEVNYPKASILLTGTLDQAIKMYELPSGTFSRFIYNAMKGSEHFQPMENLLGNETEKSANEQFLSGEIKKLFHYYIDSEVLLTIDDNALSAYNLFGKRKYEEFKNTLGNDSSFGFRYIFRILKIAGVYALVRTWLESGISKYVDDGSARITLEDFQLALELEPSLWYSYTKIYQLVSNKKVSPYAKIVAALKSTFTRQEFMNEYQLQNAGLNLSERNVTRFLAQLQKDGVIERVKNGVFKKL